MTGVAMLVVTDGRDEHLQRTVAAAEAAVGDQVADRVMYDDTGDRQHTAHLTGCYRQWTVLTAGRRLGFGGAIAYAWRVLADTSGAGWILHVEDDLVIHRPLDLEAMMSVLLAHPHLAQMALTRQPWNAEERAAGGVVEQHPAAYTDCHDQWGREWLEHRLFFTTNVSLYRAGLCAAGWPAGPHSEGRFGIRLREEGLPWGVPGDQVRFGFWGRRGDPPWTHHIGDHRAGTGY
jgi:hypothetical protein